MTMPAELRHLFPGCILSSSTSVRYVYLITAINEDHFSLAWLGPQFYDYHPHANYDDVHKALQHAYMTNQTSIYTAGSWLFRDAVKSLSHYQIFYGKSLSPMSEYIL